MSEIPRIEAGCADVVLANLAAIRGLCRTFRVRRLDLFGSAATGRFNRSRSDLDFLIEFEPMTPGQKKEAYFGMLHALEALFERKIDLVTERGLENPYRRRRIEAERQTLYPGP